MVGTHLREGRKGRTGADAATLLHAATVAARHIAHWEVLDFGSSGKPDVPSGTSRELAERLAVVRSPAIGVPLDETHGERPARGATVAGTQVHSLRLPSFTVSTEVVFAAAGERLSIRHDAGESAAPYIAGTLLAIRAVPGLVGLTRGLDTLLGPMNLSTNYEVGLLVEGFDSDPYLLMPYNPRYYPELFEACGLKKTKDLLAWERSAKGSGAAP